MTNWILGVSFAQESVFFFFTKLFVSGDGIEVLPSVVHVSVNGE
jgi:hypothetical protein